MPALGARDPENGPLARFGRESAWALTLWAEHAAELPAPWSRVAVPGRRRANRRVDAHRLDSSLHAGLLQRTFFARRSDRRLRLYFEQVIATRAPKDLGMHTLEEIELRGHNREGLVAEAGKGRVILRLWAARPEGRYGRTR